MKNHCKTLAYKDNSINSLESASLPVQLSVVCKWKQMRGKQASEANFVLMARYAEEACGISGKIEMIDMNNDGRPRLVKKKNEAKRGS